jgi:predicted S18 family serine protease
MDMAKWKLLTMVFCLFTVLFAGALVSTYTRAVKPGDLGILLERINALEEENFILAEELRRTNMSLEYYREQTDLYRERIAELEAERNRSALNITASASLEAPAITQRVEYVERYPFLERKVVYEGVMMEISVEVRPGVGRVLVVTEPLMGLVFQDAARTAVYVAQDYTGQDLSGSDVIFSVTAEEEVSAVDGPSAGALMTLLTVAALEGTPLPQDVTITGTIDKDGNIGEVGGIIEKAKAAEEAGKRLLFLSEENAHLVRYEETRERVFEWTVIRRYPKIVDAKDYIEENIGIRVEYVGSIRDVLKT